MNWVVLEMLTPEVKKQPFYLMQSVEYTSQQDKIKWKLKEQRDYLYS